MYHITIKSSTDKRKDNWLLKSEKNFFAKNYCMNFIKEEHIMNNEWAELVVFSSNNNSDNAVHKLDSQSVALKEGDTVFVSLDGKTVVKYKRDRNTSTVISEREGLTEYLFETEEDSIAAPSLEKLYRNAPKTQISKENYEK